MLNYGVLSKKPAIFKNFTGLEVAEFDALTSKIKEQYNAYEQKRLAREDRKRNIGAGHPFKLALTDRLLMLLMYYHLYPSSTLLGYLLDLGQTNVLKDIRTSRALSMRGVAFAKKAKRQSQAAANSRGNRGDVSRL